MRTDCCINQSVEMPNLPIFDEQVRNSKIRQVDDSKLEQFEDNKLKRLTKSQFNVLLFYEI